MARVEWELRTATPPEMVLAALTDFGERRPDLWPDLYRPYYEVYELGETSAEVKEGSGPPFSIWARERYDWSEPGIVRWAAVESSAFTPGSGMTVRITAADGGGSAVHCVWQRTATTLKGRVLIAMVAWSKGRVLSTRLQKAVDALPTTMSSGT
jgi:hypothetical protein